MFQTGNNLLIPNNRPIIYRVKYNWIHCFLHHIDDGASSTSSVTDNQDVPASVEGAEAASPIDPDIVPQELRELRQRLDYLKNIYDISDDQEVRANGFPLLKKY